MTHVTYELIGFMCVVQHDLDQWAQQTFVTILDTSERRYYGFNHGTVKPH